MKLRLPSGKVTMIDLEDYDRVVAQGSWYMNGDYVFKWVGGRKNIRGIYLHNFLFGIDRPGYKTRIVIDHINGNKLDNRKSNLRVTTRVVNALNRGKNSNNTSGTKGVSLDSRNSNKYWKAKFRNKSLGYFATKEEASRCYQNALTKALDEELNMIK